MGEVNTFAGAGLDRLSRRRTDEAWLRARLADPRSRALVLLRGDPYALRADGALRPARVPVAALAEQGLLHEPVLLGEDGEGTLFAVALEHEPPALAALDGAQPVGLREAGASASQRDGGLLAYAAGMLNWHRTHRFCARCASPTRMAEAGFVRACPACGALHHPRTDPVVIMLVHDGERALLGRQPSWPEGRYSALAGFVEPGESLEEAVAREVREEAGVDVDEIRYRSSQPWPFPSSLMLGFFARHAGGEARISDPELEDVRWFTREELRAAARGEGALMLPPRLAIARRLIEEWIG
ncbi:MAG: NAD(+) diphosphatase [Thermoleophilaceae bacterium]|nr:NAD(+) diphosphatase [Thermoleophilaceae bacterium]